MEAVLGGAIGRVQRRSPGLIVAVALLGGICLLGAAIVGHRLAAASGGFDVQRIDVVGDKGDGADVRAAVARQAGGASLLDLDPAAVAAAVARLPQVQRAAVDRAFPHTLSIRIVPERPVALAPGDGGRVVLAASGRVLGRASAASAGLPLLAAAPADIPGAGGIVTSAGVRDQLAVAAAMRRGLRARLIGFDANGLVARTADGTEIRFGDGADVPVKLRVARSVLRRADGPARYVDVSVPGAPALRLGAPDPLTADAPPPTAPPAARVSAGERGTPVESIRGLFG